MESSDELQGMLRATPLDGDAQARCDEIAVRLSQLAEAFAQNVVAATEDWTKHVADEVSLQGMPQPGKRRAQLSAQARQLDGYVLTLDAASRTMALQHIDDRKLRRDVYEAYVTRASDHGPRAGSFDNTPLVQEILSLRHELSLLLGFRNYAALALRDAVLQNPDEVERYLLRDAVEARARAQAELDAVWTFAKAKGAPKGFSTWDLGYYARWLRCEQLAFDEEALRSYFPRKAVVAGSFALSERLLGVKVVADEPNGHRLIAADGGDLGLLDLESCPSGLCSTEDALAVHVRHDLSRALDNHPTQLTHDQVCGLFRCVGTAVVSKLARARQTDEPTLRRVSQIAGCLFEQFCCHFDTVATFAQHSVSGGVLPRELFNQLMASRDFHAGLAATQELELALFDLRVHRDYVPVAKATELRAHVLDTLAQVRREICVLRPPFWERFANTCTTMFVEDRAARLWEGTWAKQMAAALFAQLEASGFERDALRRQRDAFWFPSERSLPERLTDVLGDTPALHPRARAKP